MAAPDIHAHESPIKTPKQLVTVVALAFIVPIIVIFMLAQFVVSTIDVDPEGGSMSPETVAARIKPVAQVEMGAAPVEKGQRAGEQIVKQLCATCHETGAAGAPKIGDKAAWAKLLGEGQKHLVETAIKGVKAMPPRGGDPSLTDIEVERAVVFMANRSGGSFKEPAPPKPAAKGAAADPSAQAKK